MQAFQVDGKYQIEFHLKFEQQQEFVRAHTMVDEIESSIKSTIPNIASVVVHIEDSREKVVDSVDVTGTSQGLIDKITELARSQQGVQECSVLSILDVKGKYRVAVKMYHRQEAFA